ncbi:MAG: rubrerythrin family protein [Dysosmobacter sp.]|nr:rubrerythrin family protein [Dysosmobacter sp.]
MSIEHTKTAENLRKALAGESIARNKYTYFAQAARANGDEEAAAAFEQMAKNEMMHAKFWFEQLYGKPSDTKECLTLAAQGEYSEWHDMYPDFARQAREEGLEELAVMFEKVAAIERSHENRFLTLLTKMGKPSELAPDAKTFSPAPKQKKEGYRCQFCGAIFERRPDVCGTCGAIGSFDCVEYYE